MAKRTVLTISQQKEWLNNNQSTLAHKWSSRGMGNSKILQGFNKNIIGKAGGCGYDRFGAALGDAMETLFQTELNVLAKRTCKVKYTKNTKKSEDYYGLFYDSRKKQGYLDGSCGSESMKRILNKIGFSLEFIGQSESTYNGEVFYQLTPVTSHERNWIK